MLKSKVGPNIHKLDDNIQTRHPTDYHSRGGGLASLDSRKGEKQTTTDTDTYLIFQTKAYKSVSNDALQAIAGIMPIDQAISLYKDTRAIARGQQTNAIIVQLKKIETPTKLKGINPTENLIQVVLSGEERLADVTLYTDWSKTLGTRVYKVMRRHTTCLKM